MTCLDLDSLKIFVAVVEASSFSRAAEMVGRTQPAVSRQLLRLEQSLGKTLILRRQGSVLGLTDDGRELLPYARKIVDLNDAAYRAVAQPMALGRVRLGVPADFMDTAFPGVLRAFQHAHGGIELEVVSDVSERLRERVRQGLLDLAFFKSLPGRGEGTVVSRQVLRWVGGASGGVPTGEEAVPLVLFPEGCVFRARILAALEASGRCWRVAYVCPSFESVLAAIRSGLGIGALPAGPMTRDLVDLDGNGLPAPGDVDIVMQIGREGG
ncbi:LysR substrate-binding domain-containing protein, partial [Telmatospirillum siberiense]